MYSLVYTEMKKQVDRRTTNELWQLASAEEDGNYVWVGLTRRDTECNVSRLRGMRLTGMGKLGCVVGVVIRDEWKV